MSLGEALSEEMKHRGTEDTEGGAAEQVYPSAFDTSLDFVRRFSASSVTLC